MSPFAYHWLSVAVTAVTVIVQMFLVGILVRRKMRSEFPVFFTYNLFAALMGILLVVAYTLKPISSNQYFYIYTAANALLMVLEFGVMYELIVVALKPYGAIIDLGKMLFRWAGLFLLVAAGLTAFATAGSLSSRCGAGSDLLEKSLRLMQCGLLFLFFLFERRLSLSWRSRPVSIAMGLGTSAAIGLIFRYLSAQYSDWWRVINVSEIGVYLLAVTYWVVCFATRAPERKSVLDSPSRLIFQRWNEALSGYGYGSAPSTVESFLPGIEKTVDRVMARRVS